MTKLMGKQNDSSRTGWTSRLAVICAAVILLETITGLAITFGPFHAAVEWGLLAHTVLRDFERRKRKER